MKKPLLLLSACVVLLAAQAQNTCLTALTITPGTHIVSGVNGSEIPTPLCAANGAVNVTASEWYRYTPAEDTTITISTEASGVDTRFHVYSGTCGALICIAGDDDSGANLTSLATFDVIGGVTYTIAFDNRWTSQGFTFQLVENVPPPPPPGGMVAFTAQTLTGVTGTTYAAVDMDGDHLDDVVSVSSTNINVLRQQLAGGFVPNNYATTPADFPASWSLSAGDLDNNGYNDLQYGAGSGVTYMMANSNGTGFTEVSFPQYVFSQRGNMVDINNDGNLDGFMCHDVDSNVYHINDGTGNLIYGSGMFGTTGGNYGSVFIDYDTDGDVDCFVAKCGGDPVDILMRNNGDGTFTSMAATLGLADNHQSWSSAWGDYDNDGHMDVLIGSSSSNYHKFMHNNGNGTFTNVTTGSGFDTFTGQSIEWNCRDFNNDGWIDIIGGGAIHYNQGDMSFISDVTPPDNGPIGDMNNDGFLDLLSGNIVHLNDGNDNNWLVVAAVGTLSNQNGIGARIRVTSAMGSQIREIRSGDGFRYMSSLNAHFGLGTDTEIEEVEIRWPSGVVDVIPGAAINGTLTVTEGTFTSVSEISTASSMIVFPNPVNDVLTVTSTTDLRNSAVVITDVTGKRVVQGVLRNAQVDVSGLGSGVYLLSIFADGQVMQHRFTKQ